MAAAVPPPGPRQRPASARARLTTSKEQSFSSSVLSHGSKEPPPPDGGSIQSGPGQYRQFGPGSRHALRDPLRQGLGRDLHFYSMGNKTANRENSTPMRTLDVAKVNQDRHQWQRVDSFQTPHGNGQAACGRENSCGTQDNSSRQQTRTASRSLEPGSQAVAGLGLEVEDLRLELRSAVKEIKEDLAAAVNQTVAELRQDVRAEAASLREQLGTQAPPSEQGRNDVAEAMLQELAKEIDKVREELTTGQRALGDELRTRMQMDGNLSNLVGHVQELKAKVDCVAHSSDDILKHMFKIDAPKIDIPSNSPVIDEVKKCQTQLAAVIERQTQIQTQIQSSESATALKGALSQGLQQIQHELQHIPNELQQIQSEIQNEFKFLKPLTRIVARGTDDSQPCVNVDMSPMVQGMKRILEELKSVDKNVDSNLQTLSSELKGTMQTFSSELKGTSSELKGTFSSELKSTKDLVRELNPSEIFAGVQSSLSKVQQWQCDFDLSPILAAVHSAVSASAVDLSPMLRVSQETKEAQSELARFVKSHHDQVKSNHDAISAGLSQLEQKTEASTQLQHATKGEVSGARSEVQGLLQVVDSLKRKSQTELDIANSLNQIMMALGKTDISCLQTELQKVHDDVKDVRRGSQQLQVRQEEDAAQMQRALQERKRADDALSDRLSEELQKMRRDFDLSEVLMAVQQIDSAKMLKAIRDNKVNSEDLAPLNEELRRLAEESRQSKFGARDLSQLLEELTTVKVEVLRQGRREPDFSTIISEVKTAVNNKRTEVDFSEVLHEFHTQVHTLKEFLASQREQELKEQAESEKSEARALTMSIEQVCSRAVASLDLSPVTSEICAVKSKIELASALKRQTQPDHLMTKADFAAAFEELRGHFSLLLNGIREVGKNAGSQKSQPGAVERQELAKAAEDFDYVRKQVRDAQYVAGQAGSRTAELLHKVQGRRGQTGNAADADDPTVDAFAQEVSTSFMQ